MQRIPYFTVTLALVFFWPCLALAHAPAVVDWGGQGKIAKIKGVAYQLKSFGDSREKKVALKVGEAMPAGTMLFTGPLSMVQVSFAGKGTVTLGPSSRMRMEESQRGRKGPPLLRLFRGMIRGTFLKQELRAESGLNKFMVGTPSAAVGVRGTDFLVSFNEKNKITSAITITGEVAQLKTDYAEGKEDPWAESKLDQKLAHDLTTSVAPGEFAASFPGHRDVSTPVKISPRQYQRLKENIELNFEDGPAPAPARLAPSSEKSEDKERVRANEVLIPRPQDLHESYITQEVAEYGPRPGGYLDLETGLYISPPDDAAYDEKEKVYIVPAEFGGVDEKTGDYRPPAGLGLDPLKGFVILKDALAQGAATVGESLSSLDRLAARMNAGLVDNILSKIDQKLKAYPFLDKLNFNFYEEYYYDTNIMEKVYGETTEVTHLSSNKFLSGASLARKMYFQDETWAVTPKVIGQFLYHAERSNPIISQHDRGDFNLKLDLSRRQRIFRRNAELSLELSNNRYYREYQGDNVLRPDYRDWTFAVSESMQFLPNQSTLLHYSLSLVNGREGLDHGKVHDSGFVHSIPLGAEATMGLAGRYLEKVLHGQPRSTRIYEGEIFYKRPEVFRDTSLVGNGGIRLTRPVSSFQLYELEREFTAGFALRRQYSSYVSWGLSYQYARQFSKERDRFNFHKHLTGLALALIF